jgi:Putative sensor
MAQSEASVTGVLFESQTYRNLAYLLLSFVLGIAYLVFLVTGLSVGVGLTAVWVGIPILLLVTAAWWKLAAFERMMAGRLLGVSITPPTPRQPNVRLVRRVTRHFGDSLTWKSLLFLLLKFPLGIISFVLSVTLISTSLSLLAVPFLYRFADITVGPFAIDTPMRALYFGGLGAFIGVWSLHGLNAWSRLCGWVATKLLSPKTLPSPVVPG